jgi:hypothetical protein
MTSPIDELFGDGEGQTKPRLRLVWALLAGGLCLLLPGMLFSTVPGGLLILVAWMVIETERGRAESGYLPTHTHPSIYRLRNVTFSALIAMLLLVVVQGVFLNSGFYEPLWSGWIGALLDVVLKQ